MPTDDQIAKLEEQLIAQAPEGLSEQEFNTWLSARMNEALSADRTWKDTAVDALPAIGGAIGGIVGSIGGPPGAVTGAAIGGAGGEGWRRTIQGLRGKRPEAAQETVGDTLKGVATEGAVQGATEAVGGVVGAGLKRGGKALYRGLLKPRDAVVAKYGDVVPGLIESRRLITPGGARKSAEAMKASKAAADELISSTSDAAPYITPKDATKYFGEVEDELRKRALGGQADETAKVAKRMRRLRAEMTADTGVGLDLQTANTVKRSLDRASDGAQRAVQRGSASQLSADDLLNDATRKAMRERIEEVSGVGPLNAQTRRLAGETTALKQGVKRTANNLAIGPREMIAAGIGTGTGLAAGDEKKGATAGILARLLMSPRIGSAAAIGADMAGDKAAQIVRILEEMYRESGRE